MTASEQAERRLKALISASGHGQPEQAYSEIVSAYRTLAPLAPAVSVFGSARTPADDPEYELSRQLAYAIGQAGFPVITGGGPGAMEAANRGAQEAGVPSVGLHIQLPNEQRMNPYVDLPVVFRYFFARKIFYVDPAFAFIAVPGGAGTLDELFEVLTLQMTARIPPAPLLLVGRDYWQGLYDWLARSVVAGQKMRAEELALIEIVDEIDETVARIEAAHAMLGS